MRSPKSEGAKNQEFSIPFTSLKNKVLARNYELSLAFIGENVSRKLNATYRKKNKPANVLSFPLSKKSGEIFIDLVTAKKECRKFNMTYQKFVKLLFIHGLLHLKGMRHGARMERAQKKYLNDAPNRSWH